MSRWKSVVTNVGLNLLSNVTDSRAINIVAVKGGTGKVDEDSLINQTNISGYKCDLQIVASSQTSDTNYRVTARLANDSVSESFNLTQVGVFATLGDSTTEVLFMVIQCSDEGDVIPASTLSKGFTATYQLNLAFSNSENVNITVVPVVDGLAAVATSGSYEDLTNKPKLSAVAVSGSYGDLTDTPELSKVAVSGKYKDLLETPELSDVALSNDYGDLYNTPFASCGSAEDFNNAINGIKDSGGKVYLRAGTYDFTKYNLSIGYDNITVEGSGKGTVIKLGASSKISVLGNNVGFKNLTILRDEDSSNEVIFLDSDGTHISERFELSDITIDCAKTTAQLVRVTSNGAFSTRFLNCILTSGGTQFIKTTSSTIGGVNGIVSECIAASILTVPKTMTLGVNYNVISEE